MAISPVSGLTLAAPYGVLAPLAARDQAVPVVAAPQRAVPVGRVGRGSAHAVPADRARAVEGTYESVPSFGLGTRIDTYA